MESFYRQKLSLFGSRFVITYNYREGWNRLSNNRLKPPVVIMVFPSKNEDSSILADHLEMAKPDLIFIIREYLSLVAKRFEGIRFTYELVNYDLTREEKTGTPLFYRAELKWNYSV